MEYEIFIETISLWGYPLLFILMMIEGPFSTLTGAFLASLGTFNVFIVLIMSILADVIADTVFYLSGYFGGSRLLARAEKLFRIKRSLSNRLKKRFQKNEALLVFLVKITSGLGIITYVLAGTTRMRFRKFLFYSVLGGMVWSSFLVFIGYFFGYAIREINRYIQYGSWAVILVIAVTLIIFFLIKYQKRSL